MKMGHNILINNGRVVDGTGNTWFITDIGITNGKIAAMGDLSGEEADQVIDATGYVVSPGFIDIHSHTDTFHITNPTGDSFIMQGVTTNIIGNCGISVAPISKYKIEDLQAIIDKYKLVVDWSTFHDFFKRLEDKPTSLNVGSLVGHGTVRMAAMGMDNRVPNTEELEKMKTLVGEAMRDGAFGMSSGLWYPPGSYAHKQEVIELAKVVAKYDGVYITHMRSEEDAVIEALKETLEIGEEAKIKVEISHIKSAGGMKNWGKINEMLPMIENARRRGIDVTSDVYSWTAGSTGLAAYLPNWVSEGGLEKLVERLKSPDIRKRIKHDMKNEARFSFESIGWDNFMISQSALHPEYQGKFIGELARKRNKDPYEYVFDLLIEENGRVSLVVFEIDPKDVTTVIKNPLSMMASDGSAISPWGGMEQDQPHPRSYANFVNVLSKYVREEGVITLEEAIRKMTSMPAQRLGLYNRGLLRIGNWADVVIFDPKVVAPRATYMSPHQFPVGVKWVIVNGVVTVEGEKHTGARAGKVLRKTKFVD